MTALSGAIGISIDSGGPISARSEGSLAPGLMDVAAATHVSRTRHRTRFVWREPGYPVRSGAAP